MFTPRIRSLTAGLLVLATLGTSTFAMLQTEIPAQLERDQLAFNDKPQTPPGQMGQSESAGMELGGGDIVDIILGGVEAGNQGAGSVVVGGRSVADVLTTSKESLWWTYARDCRDVAERLEGSEKSSTVLVPVDKAILSLPKKPHQGAGTPEESTDRFIKSHIIGGPVNPGPNPTLLKGFEVELVKDKTAKGGWRANPGGVEVLGEREGGNGKVIWLAGVLTYKDE